MQVSRTLDYAVRCLIHMGGNPGYKFSMKQISETQHIPQNYLAKVMRRLVNRGILRSKVGPEGGYMLRKAPHELSLREVYEAIEGEIRIVDCMDDDGLCALYENCGQLPLWDKLKFSMIRILEDTTIADMVDETRGGKSH
jgi:Rrf2 family protein